MNVVFCDIDGTFQDIGVDVPKINYDAIDALQKQGDHFVFISGRGYSQLTELMESLTNDCDVIFSNGAGYKLIGEEPVYQHDLSIEECQKAINVLEERTIFYHIHTNTGVILKPVQQYEKQLLALREKLKPLGETGGKIMDFKEGYFKEECQHVEEPIEYLKTHPEVKVVKIEIMEADDQELEALRELLTSDTMYVFSSFIQCMEMVNPLSSKGYAIKEFMRKYPKAKSYGIGDGENDLAMLDVVDVAVAVGNAKDIVKEKSAHIVSECKDGGVGEFIFNQLITDK
ncbi:HAD-IIB family hydrolase [Enterococcus quebecensis]|uniref:Hydrolase n=1 Tax=Enterococcus quebecensis TaxID=903983 RepID=A0A1E5GUX9_9ENTE|nr:HAD family hydrolase [Enterococcus quebecensis]OEG16437.1 hydrolase [Enterococcus quebecensis]OJG74200.1 cof-like hydrolase [Enterococcus quebecensis]